MNLNFVLTSQTMKTRCRLWTIVMALGGTRPLVPASAAFTICTRPSDDVAVAVQKRSWGILRLSSNVNWNDALNDNADDRPPQSQQEKMLEESSQIGADKIATLSIPERTKRAMLAEAIEDELFVATEQLEDLYNQSSTSSPSTSSVSNDDAETRNTAVELAKRIRSLQAQYNELVSGGSSSVLNVLESIALGPGEDDNDDSDDEKRINSTGTLE
jgi:hypothetical protein